MQSDKKPKVWIAVSPEGDALYIDTTRRELCEVLISGELDVNSPETLEIDAQRFIDNGWQIKPVYLISPDRLEQLERLEEWAREAYTILEDGGSNWDVAEICAAYKGIASSKEPTL